MKYDNNLSLNNGAQVQNIQIMYTALKNGQCNMSLNLGKPATTGTGYEWMWVEICIKYDCVVDSSINLIFVLQIFQKTLGSSNV